MSNEPQRLVLEDTCSAHEMHKAWGDEPFDLVKSSSTNNQLSRDIGDIIVQREYNHARTTLGCKQDLLGAGNNGFEVQKVNATRP